MKKIISILIILSFLLTSCIDNYEPELDRRVYIDKFGCKSDYPVYDVQSEERCMERTGGHCSTTKMNKDVALADVGHCLCEKYEANNTIDIAQAIIDICIEDNSCEVRYNKLFEGEELDVEKICQKKEDLFDIVYYVY